MSDVRSVYAAFGASAARFPHQPFLAVPASVAAVYGEDAREVSYADAANAVGQALAHYRAAGYGPGHRVAFMLDNRAAFFTHWFALNALGTSVVPINAELGAKEQAYLLDLSEADLWLVHDAHVDAAERALAQATNRPAILVLSAAAAPPPARSPADTARIDTDTECAMLFTSGSTGQPKACVLTNDYFLEMGRWYCGIGGLCALTEGRERLLTPLPLTHMNAMATSLMAMVMSGGCLVQLDRFHASSWWDTVHETRPSVIHYLGVMPAILLQREVVQHERCASVRFGFGAGVNPAHHAPFEARFGFPLIEAWAMTETGAGGCIVANREPRHVGRSCFGRPDPDRLACRLVDETGADVAPGEAGELLVRATGANPRKGFFAGYYANAAATEEGWSGGWWHTGDVVRQLEDGSMCFVDRRKNIIRRSGENIAALEVEAVLSRHAAVRVVAVAPVPDEIRGEEVMALVILDDGHIADAALAAAIFDHAAAALAYFKTPGYLAFVDELPLTATQKPQRGAIKTLAATLAGTTARDGVHDLRARKRKPAA